MTLKVPPALAPRWPWETGCRLADNPQPGHRATIAVPRRPRRGGCAADENADHLANASGTGFTVPENHVPWTPDAPLMEGMSRVRTAIAGLQAEPQPDAATVAARAADIDAAVDYMFKNCKLPTEPDIALHAILARLMATLGPEATLPTTDGALTCTRVEIRPLFDDPDGGPRDAMSRYRRASEQFRLNGNVPYPLKFMAKKGQRTFRL